MRPLLLDLFCKQGGAAMGYHRAGFDVVGVDIEPQPRYPFEFVQADTLEYLRVMPLDEFSVVHASPPCQAYTNAQKIQGREHSDLISPVRDYLDAIGLPYVIENVPGSPLLDPIELCGGMFGLGTYRHRLFESSIPLDAPFHWKHFVRTTKMGRKPIDGEMMHVVGNFSGVEQAKTAMGIDWMNRDGLRESIPPAYTEFVGLQLMEHLMERAA